MGWGVSIYSSVRGLYRTDIDERGHIYRSIHHSTHQCGDCMIFVCRILCL